MAVEIPMLKSDQVAMVVVAAIFGSISSFAVSLRLFVVLRISQRSLDASDICILVAWIFTLGLMVTCIAGKERMLAELLGLENRGQLTLATEAVLGGFGWHYDEIVAEFGQDPIIQYHKVSCSCGSSIARHFV